MNGISKTRFSGFVIIIILILILVLSIFTVLSRNVSEDKLIQIGFVKLQQYSRQLQSKIDVLYTTRISGNRNWKKKDYSMIYHDDRWYIVYKKKNDLSSGTKDSLDISDTISYDFLDRKFFNEYIIFDEENVLYKSLKTEFPDSANYLEYLKANLYLPSSYKIFNMKKDSDLKDIFHNTGFISKTVINYEIYYQFVYPFKIQDKEFFISGFLTSKNYLGKKQHVEIWILLVIGILLLFTLFSFPFIKLFLLSKTERIKTSDLVMLCFSISGIACIVTLLIINLNTLVHLKVNTEKQLISLNDSIKSDFVNELNLMYNTAEGYEEYEKGSFNVKGYVLTNQKFAISDSLLKRRIMIYPYFKELFCSDKGRSERIVTTWETDTRSPIFYRDYYKKKDEWLLPGPGEERRFRLQSIYSNTTGEVSAVLAKPSKTNSKMVYCISSPMFSVINTILPPGYEFRIIGQDGLVWFHNNQQKNTRENFLEECDHNDQIQEAIHNRVETSFAMKISLENYQAYMSPVGSLPLYMITLCNTKEQNEFLSHVNYDLFIFIVIGILFAVIASAIFYFEKIDKEKRTNTAGDSEPGLIWLLADSRKNRRYIVIFSLNIFLGLFISLPVFVSTCTVLHYLLILFSAYSLCFIYTYLLLKCVSPNLIKKSMIITYALILVMCNIIYLICLSPFNSFIIPEALAITITGLIVFVVQRNQLFPKLRETVLKSGIKFLWSSKSPSLPYALFICSWLVIGCILPTIYLFRIAGREEVDLLTRKNQLELATKIERKGILIDSFYIAHIYPDKNPAGDPYLNILKTNLKQKGNYLLNLSEIPVIESMKSVAFSDIRPDSDYLLLNKYLRLMIRKEDIRSYQMLYGVGLDTSWFWTGGYFSRTKPDTLKFHYKAKQKDAGGFYSGYQFRLSSVLHNQKTAKMSINSKSALFNTLVILILLLFLFRFIQIIIKKLFILERPEIPNTIETPQNIPKSVNTFLVNTLNHHHIVKWIKSACVITEPYQTLELKSLQNVLIILYPVPENPGKWDIFINTLEELFRRDSGQVILLSPYTPVQIREIVEEQIQSTSTNDTKDALTEINQHLMRLFSHFIVSFIPDKTNGKVLSRMLGLNNPVLGNDLVIGNIGGALTPKSQKTVYSTNNLPGSESDLYNLLSSQYHYLWKTCTTNEKFILFDLSMDSLVNGKNTEDIKNLVGKGILDVDGKLCFVSNGFKRYVTEMVDSEEFIIMEKKSKMGDGWNKIKYPLYLIFGAIVMFFFFTQQEIFTGITGAIIALTGILGTLMKVLSVRSAETGK
jgi:hypothetical protein